MKNFKQFLTEGAEYAAVDSNKISMPNGKTSTVPWEGMNDDNLVLMFLDKKSGEEFTVQGERKGGPYSVEYSKYDKRIKDINALCTYLNSVNAKYLGVDDR